MDLTSLLLIQNGISQFPNQVEPTAQDAPEPIRNSGGVLRNTTRSKRVMKIVPFAGAGLLAAALFLKNASSTGIVSVQEDESSALICHYMTVSLLPGGKLNAKSDAVKGAGDVSCSKTMLETSLLCRQACISPGP
jgi:hypothetical protein